MNIFVWMCLTLYGKLRRLKNYLERETTNLRWLLMRMGLCVCSRTYVVQQLKTEKQATHETTGTRNDYRRHPLSEAHFRDQAEFIRGTFASLRLASLEEKRVVLKVIPKHCVRRKATAIAAIWAEQKYMILCHSAFTMPLLAYFQNAK